MARAAVLLIARANIANLRLARGAAGQRDVAIRRAIGASRDGIVVQLFAESVLLGTVSAIAALLVGSWLTRLLISLLARRREISLCRRRPTCACSRSPAVTAATVVLFRLLLAWQNSRVVPVATLRERRA